MKKINRIKKELVKVEARIQELALGGKPTSKIFHNEMRDMLNALRTMGPRGEKIGGGYFGEGKLSVSMQPIRTGTRIWFDGNDPKLPEPVGQEGGVEAAGVFRDGFIRRISNTWKNSDMVVVSRDGSKVAVFQLDSSRINDDAYGIIGATGFSKRKGRMCPYVNVEYIGIKEI